MKYRHAVYAATIFLVGTLSTPLVFRHGLAEDPLTRNVGRAGTLRDGGRDARGPKKRRLRQGTMLEKVKGQFRLAGDRVAFYPDELEVTELTVLENLALERLATIIAEERQRTWVVSGTVTEFRGKNYLLVSRAVMASAASSAKESR